MRSTNTLLMHSLQPMQGRMSSVRPSRALRTSSGSEIRARAIPTTSAWPSARIRSATDGLVTRPVYTTGTSISAFTRPTRPAKAPGGYGGGGMYVGAPQGLPMTPWRKSMPCSSSSSAISMASSFV